MRYKNNKNLENNKSVRFYFDNKEYFGFEGDTLASALLANDVHLVGRSFKYHRPRGIYTAGSEEPNGIVQLETKEYTEPNRRVTEVQIYDGLKAFSQNNWPSVKFDAGAINDLLSPFFPAGFYYKTFMWPPKFWKAYEFFIRHAAGLGKSPKKDDPHKYEHFHYHCDVLVVGAGVSGLISAEIAANNNYKVLLIEQEDDLGGEILSTRNQDIKIDNLPINEWKNKIVDKLSKNSNIKIVKNTTCFAYLNYNLLLAVQEIDPEKGLYKKNDIKERIWKIRSKKVILATGTIERPIIFNNNDQVNWNEISVLLDEWKPELIIIGKPLNMDGTDSEIMKKVEKFVKHLKTIYDAQYEYIDERLTTFEAKEILIENKSDIVDANAAKILIDNWFNKEL